MQQRNQLLDLAKGFAIVLVVLGHAIQYNIPHVFDSNIIFKAIYAFHMPLFMFISGYVAFGTFRGEVEKFIKRMKTLLIPFFSWFLLTFLVLTVIAIFSDANTPSFFNALKTLITFPDHGLWFLWVLFLNYFLLFIALKITQRHEELILVLFVILLNVELEYFNFHKYGIRLTSWHLCFFTCGYIFSKYTVFMSKLTQYLGWACVLLFPFLLTYWSRTSAPAFVFNLQVRHGIQSLITYLFNAIIGMTGILAIFSVLKSYLNSSLKFTSQMILLGTLTLEIYTTHMILIPYLVLFTPYFAVNVLITFTLAIGIAYLLQGWIKKVKVLSLLLYGR